MVEKLTITGKDTQATGDETQERVGLPVLSCGKGKS